MNALARRGIGGHTRPNGGATVDWITPKEIIAALGPFDFDPCSSDTQPWPTATRMLKRADNGLAQLWEGRTWCNPPYGNETGAWLSKLAAHGNGIALIFARTETAMFVDHVWHKATALLFLAGRLYFHLPNGDRASANAGGPSVLVAYGRRNLESLKNSGIAGALVTEWRA